MGGHYVAFNRALRALETEIGMSQDTISELLKRSRSAGGWDSFMLGQIRWPLTSTTTQSPALGSLIAQLILTHSYLLTTLSKSYLDARTRRSSCIVWPPRGPERGALRTPLRIRPVNLERPSRWIFDALPPPVIPSRTLFRQPSTLAADSRTFGSLAFMATGTICPLCRPNLKRCGMRFRLVSSPKQPRLSLHLPALRRSGYKRG